MRIVTLHKAPSSSGKESCDFGCFEEMATLISSILKDQGRCAPSDLLKARIPAREVKAQWDLARCFAQIDLEYLEEDAPACLLAQKKAS